MPSLSSIPSPAALRVLVLLTFGLSGLATPPARADIPVVALEAAEILPVPSDDRGHTPPNVALRPDGGYIAVWADLASRQVIGRWFGPPDANGDSESELFELSSEDATAYGPVVMARGVEGSRLAVWRGSGAVSAGLVGRAFDGDGRPLAEARTVVPGGFGSFRFEPFDLAARPGGGYVLAWGEEGVDGWEIWYRFLGGRGRPLASGLVAALPEGAEGSQPRVAVAPGGVFVVTWRTWQGSDDPGSLQARAFSGSGLALGSPFELLPDEPSARVFHDVAATGPEDFLLAWRGRGGPENGAGRILVRRFGSDGTLEGASRLDVGDEADRFVTRPALAAVPGGGAVAAWAEGIFRPTAPKARLIDGEGAPRSGPFDLLDGALEGDFVNAVQVDRDAEGRLVFGWGESVETHFIPTDEQSHWTARARRFLELPPPPPDAPPLTTDAVPGFRFWVEITDQGGDAILGSELEPCIPETLCVSGRLPGRHEVFARIVGPKPNGRLWPTLVKFTTSQVEVWIEQVATGEVEYYLLEGARPGFDELPGLFDREGFEP